jgi:hypothetical protein
LVVAALALLGSAVSARAESGQFIFGGRLGYNYSNISFTVNDRYGSYYADYSDGGHGFEGGLIGRYAIVEGQMGVNIGANYLYRTPFYYYYWGSKQAQETTEMAVSVPLLFEVSPATFGGSSVYELMFLQIGVQVDYIFKFDETINGKSLGEKERGYDREKVNVGLVLGAVGYFNSHCSLDLRFNYSFTKFAKFDAFELWTNSFLYSGSLGLSFYL